MLRIFSVPKPFQGPVAVIQRNAIDSWTIMRPEFEVILVGNDQGIGEVAQEFRVRHIPQIAVNNYGRLMVDSMFQLVGLVGKNDLMCLAPS